MAQDPDEWEVLPPASAGQDEWEVLPPAPRAASRPAPAPRPAPAQPQQDPAPRARGARSPQGGTPGVSVTAARRSMGDRFLDAASDTYRRTIPAALARMLASGMGDQEYVDPETGERFTYRGLGTQTREDERARREAYEARAAGDAWYDRPGVLNKMLAGGATLAGGFAGAAADPTNFLGGFGGNILRRIGIDAAVGGAQDVAAQGLDIGAGVQDRYSGLQTLGSAAANAFLPVAIEGAGRVANRMLPQAEARAAGGAPAGAGDGGGAAGGRRVVTLPDGTEIILIGPGARPDIVAGGIKPGDYVDPDTGNVYRPTPPAGFGTTTDPFTGATVPEPGGQAAAPATTAPPASAAAARPASFTRDNPGGEWLEAKQARAEAAMAGSPSGVGMSGRGVTGSVTATAGVRQDANAEPMTLPVDVLRDLPGVNGEAPAPGQPKYDALSASVAEKGWQQPDAILVMVNHKGEAYIAEGNNRVAIAAREGVDRIPVEIQWRNGGERAEGPLSPARVAELERVAPPRAAALAEDVGAPGRAPDEVLLGPVVRGLDDEFGIPPQPSAAVARAADADLTLRPNPADGPDPDLVGNIRLSNLNSDQDIEAVLATARQAGGGFEEARRGVQSFADTEELAALSGTTVKDLLARRNGQAFNAEELTVARNLMVASAEKVDDLAARVAEAREPGEDLLDEFREAMLRHVAIQEQVSGAVAEAGRALGILRNKASSRDITPEMLDAMLAGKGPSGLRDTANKILKARQKGLAAHAKAIKEAYKPNLFDAFLEYWYNAILSGPYTHLYNVLSTGVNVLAQMPELATASAIGGARRALNIGDPDRVLASEIGVRGAGMLTGAVEGARAFGQTLRTGATSDGVDKMDTRVRQAIPGMAGTVIRTPGRVLAAEDEFFKAVARRMQINGISLRMAHAEGLRGDVLRQRAAELAANPSEYLQTEAENYARYLTFQTEMGPLGRAILRGTEAFPAARIVVPFVRTPMNLMKTAVERSPFAPVLKEWREDVAAGGARADTAIARVATGTAFGMAIASAAGYGLVTGAAPTDKTERDALLASGWQPFSLRIGNQYVDYRRMDPFSTIIGVAATMGQPQGNHDDDENRAMKFISGFLQQLTDKTFLPGVSDFVEALSDPGNDGRKLRDWVNRFAGSFIPAAVSQTAQTMDPERRVAETLPDVMRSRIPGMSQDLPARRDILGDTMPTFSPARPVENDPVAQAIIAAGGRVGPPSKTVGGRKLTPQEYDDYQRVSGRNLRAGLARWIDTQDWRELSDEERRELISEIANEAREDARYELGLAE